MINKLKKENQIVVESRLSDEFEPENTNDYYDDSMDDDYINKIKSGELYKESNEYEDSRVETIIDNIKNWTDHDVHIQSIYEDDDEATLEVYMPETNEYVGTWDVELDKCEDQYYCDYIAAEINAVDVGEIIEECVNKNNIIKESTEHIIRELNIWNEILIAFKPFRREVLLCSNENELLQVIEKYCNEYGRFISPNVNRLSGSFDDKQEQVLDHIQEMKAYATTKTNNLNNELEIANNTFSELLKIVKDGPFNSIEANKDKHVIYFDTTIESQTELAQYFKNKLGARYYGTGYGGSWTAHNLLLPNSAEIKVGKLSNKIGVEISVIHTSIEMKESFEDSWDYDDDELADIYGGDSNESQKAIATDMAEMYKDELKIESWQDNYVEPTIEENPIETYNGLDIYKGTDHYGEETYYIFLEDETPDIGYEEWEAETLELAKEWASSYWDEDNEIFNDEEDDDDEFIDIVDESTKLTEGGIYPVDLDDGAIDALENKLSKILNGGIQVKKLELLPAYGFGGAGIYWYKCDIDLYDEVVVNLLDKKLTPVAYAANENNDLIIYLPSITINCSYSDEYTPYIQLDSKNESDDYNKLKEEEKYIENKIVELLKNNKNELVELLKDYEIVDDDYEELNEGLIIIKESDEEEFYQRNIYDILDNISVLADSYDNAENDEKLKKLGQTISRIEDELKILKKVYMDATVGIKHIQLTNESSEINLNKDKAKIAFDNLIEPFDGTDIKTINQDIKDTEGNYSASIRFNDEYSTFVNDVRNNWEEYEEGTTYLKYEDFGIKQVNLEYEEDGETIKRINVYVEYID